MSGFLDKFKKGAAEAGEKAKVLLEVNKIKLQITQKQKEIDDEYKKIGELVFKAYQNETTEDSNGAIEECCKNCIKKREEIQEMEDKVRELNEEKTYGASDDKTCPTCGKLVGSERKFCPACGHNFTAGENHPSTSQVTAKTNVCPTCEAAVEAGSKFCVHCGTKLG